ncbi:hypothetical protein A6F68_00109 [Tsuneonella dongtanensis]|uniref:Bacterial extracellular solute-binding protein n=1 Tax=Tsuneonella dongtanensis TaxID=692370 RepID=A0A1B2A9B6_9SPHN|nr:extracellular solute-binding protein [Tsuneonella dongtanensis]ANY18645.1 hypothetical protein A6F68_00109 [Tsuneonella dongtanensis]
MSTQARFALKGFLPFSLCLASLTACDAGAGDNPLVVITSGGAMRAAQVDVIGSAYREVGGKRVVWGESIGGNLVEVYAQDRARNVLWDAVIANPSSATRACERGILAKLDPADMLPGNDGTIAEDDFVEQAVSPCFIGSTMWSLVLAYRCDSPEGIPQGAADFFDIEKFPGRRGIQRWPVYTLELALVADGVPPEQVYEVLATRDGVARAFAKIDTIKPQIVWWDSGAQAAQLIADQEVSMTLAPAGRIISASVGEQLPICIQWRNQILTQDVWVVPKRSKNKKAAIDFLKVATRPDVQARMAERLPYSPSRISALKLVGKSPTLGVEMRPLLPTAPENLVEPIRINDQFWADHEGEILPQFYAWLESK